MLSFAEKIFEQILPLKYIRTVMQITKNIKRNKQFL